MWTESQYDWSKYPLVYVLCNDGFCPQTMDLKNFHSCGTESIIIKGRLIKCTVCVNNKDNTDIVYLPGDHDDN